MEFRELWHNTEKSWLQEASPQSGPESLLHVRASHSLVSQGTERLVTTGGVPEDMRGIMRIPYMQGDFSNQFTYGYSLVGNVEDGPNELRGRMVHILHPHQELALVDSSHISIVPENIPPEVATLASNMETAVNAVWDSEVALGDQVMIIGFGVVGALIGSILLNMNGVDVLIVEKNQKRAGVASSMGFRIADPENMDPEFDIAFNTSASAEGLQIALDKTRQEGRTVEVSWYGLQSTELKLGSSFHFGRKKVVSTQVSNIPYSKQPEWNYARRKQLVWQLLGDSFYEKMLDHVIEFSATPGYYQKLRDNNLNEFSTLIKY